jgi:hypothetical protein
VMSGKGSGDVGIGAALEVYTCDKNVGREGGLCLVMGEFRGFLRACMRNIATVIQWC